MTSNNEHDALGELFRRRLENHRIPDYGNGWDAIEHRLNKRKKKAAVWLWSAGITAAAASIALLLTVRQPASEETAVVTVSQQVSIEEKETAEETTILNPDNDKLETGKTGKIGETGENGETEEIGENGKNRKNESVIQLFGYSVIEKDSVIQLFSYSVIEKDSVIQLFNHSVIENLVGDDPDEEEESGKTEKKWLFAAAFGTGGSTNGFDVMSNDYSVYDSPMAGWDGMGRGNDYATELSSSIRSFNSMKREDFTNIQHSPPFSFGLTARKSLRKNIGVESGLVYTYLSSRFEGEGYNAHQSLHYIGIPVNMAVYFGNSKSNWRAYLSGGFMVEKGLRAKFVQQENWVSASRNTTVKSSAISGLQWSLNGALGVNYRLEKGWGIYFEPRVGYSFDCNQPISIRTEKPLFFGINMGLNYEL